jgi:hypothetical protein
MIIKQSERYNTMVSGSILLTYYVEDFSCTLLECDVGMQPCTTKTNIIYPPQSVYSQAHEGKALCVDWSITAGSDLQVVSGGSDCMLRATTLATSASSK